MRSRITTTITTYIDLDTFTPEHEVSINAEDALPREVVIAAASGGLRNTLNALYKENPRAVGDDPNG